MVNITSNYDTGKSATLTLVVIICMVTAIVLNVFFLFVLARVRRLRRPPNWMLVHLAVVDIIAALAWLIPVLVAASTWSWLLGKGLCYLHVYISMWCYASTTHGFTVIAFEKCIRFLFPSKHQDAFMNNAIMIVVFVSLWIFDCVIAFLPLVGWGKIEFFPYQMQCITDYVQTPSHLSFIFTVTYLLPILLIAILYLAITIKVAKLKRKVGPSTNQKFVLEEKKDVPKESYADKLKKQSQKFKNVSNKDKKPCVGGKKKDKPEEGYVTASDVTSSSEDEFFTDYKDYKEMRREKEQRKFKRRVFTFKKEELGLAITLLFVYIIYCALWLPFHIVTFVWVYDPYSVSEWIYILATTLTFFGITYKPLIILLTNRTMRLSMKEAFKGRKKKQTKFKKQDPCVEPEKPKIEKSSEYTYTTTETKFVDGQEVKTTRTHTTRDKPDLSDLYQTSDTKFQY